MSLPSITPHTLSPELDPAEIRIAVVIPTYKRPVQVIQTINSVTAQITQHAHAVVVVENDAKGGEGVAAASQLLINGTARGIVIIEPRQGNCNAYNAGFAAALATFPHLTHVAIIDDDEVAAPAWLESLMAAASSASIVGGPVFSHFDDKAGAIRFADHPVFRLTQPGGGSAGIITSTGNCLISVDVLKRMGAPWLDESFNFLGGGDTDFFTRCRTNGFTFQWAKEAAVTETVPARRTQTSWITARSLRNGLISSLIQRKQSPGIVGRCSVIAKSFALLAVSPVRSLLLWRETGSFYIGSYHMMIAAGRLLAEFGYTIEQYRAPEKN